MFNRRFEDAVRHRLINIQAAEARAAKQGAPAVQAPAYGQDDVAAFVDLQNLHYFLKENCRLPATQVHVPNLLRDWSRAHDLPLRELHIFTGIHDRRREPQRHDAMANRVRWLERMGCIVVTLPLSYYTQKGTNEVRAQEKGIDVRIGSEILRAVNGGLRRALVITQDKDISQAVKVASEMALERGSEFKAFSMTLVGTDWEHNGKCGMYGVAFTEKLPIDIDFIQGYVREERPRSEVPASGVAAEA
jgi:uncharacterized LabA/DUF88 family protein